ncbi:Asp23/Gls24 family envelope stress response protein [Enterococcus sp. AZ109]|uniref:Asp23/Gls24 family envelope stress response protein n=1 Tax=Enterococcus sp. AZ109 TaxID=2774634 RepID=UPI003F21AD16
MEIQNLVDKDMKKEVTESVKEAHEAAGGKSEDIKKDENKVEDQQTKAPDVKNDQDGKKDSDGKTAQKEKAIEAKKDNQNNKEEKSDNKKEEKDMSKEDMNKENKDMKKDADKKETKSADNQDIENIRGEVEYDDSVIKKIIAVALDSVDGLLNVDGGFFSNTAKKISNNADDTAGIETEVGKKQVAIDMDVVVEFGKDIQEIFENLKQVVAKEVKQMTGLDVIEVNLKVVDIKTKEEHEKDKETLQDKASEQADDAKKYVDEKREENAEDKDEKDKEKDEKEKDEEKPRVE